jgi:predicted AlkP superfamily phosphohydrolase/phosphomutase
MPARTFVFGIDGATFDVISPMVESGRLPNLGRLLREGSCGPLRSTIHPITPAAWSSFATGMNPGKHGVFDFSSPVRATYGVKLNNASDRRCESVWGLLSRQRKHVTVVNVPFTYPPEAVNGILVSGFDTPGADRSMSHPREVYDELVARFGSYTPDWSFPAGRRYDPERYRQNVLDVIRQRGETTLYLMEKYPWDFFMTVFQSIDHVQHVFFGLGDWGMEFIRQAYEAVDHALGRVLEKLDDDTVVMVVSDHGAGNIRKVFFLDQWLERERYLAPKQGATFEGLLRQVGRRGRKLAKAILPTAARGYLRGRMPGMRDMVVSLSSSAPVDWSRTRAYSAGMYGNIFINLKGREAQGIVAQSEYRALCDEIRERLLRLEDPDSGERVVEAVHHRDEVYSGPFVADAPDLLIHWKDYAYFTKKGIDRAGQIFSSDLTLDASNFPHTGTHRIDGIFLARGACIRPGQWLSDLRIVDVAPSLLYLQGAAIPNDMDGRLPAAMFDDGYLSANPPQYSSGGATKEPPTQAPPSTGEEDEMLRERLRSLGYIE